MQTEMTPIDVPPAGRTLAEEAALLERLMPMILRRLFSLSHARVLAEMPLAQLRICSFLHDGPRSMSAIADELGMSTSAVTQIADRMERGGLVERSATQEDRRLKHLHLTPHAQKLMEDRRSDRTRRAAEALALLPSSVRSDLISALDALLTAAVATAPPVDAGHPDSTESAM